MFNVTTRNDVIYDPILGKSVSKKVFMIRGDESYAKSTDISISADVVDTGGISGFVVDFDVALYRSVGESTVVIYDNDEILDMRSVTNAQGYSLSNIVLSYGVEHNIHAVYHGNNECLSSKSKSVKLYEPLPYDLVANINFSNTQYNIDVNGNIDVPLNVTVNGEAYDSATVLIYVDSVLYDTVITNGEGDATVNISGVDEGLHTITATVESANDILGSSKDASLSVGYNITFITIPDVFINNSNNTVKVNVKNYNDVNISNMNVSFAGLTSRTNNDGIATFVVTNIINDTVYTASTGNSNVQRRLNSFTVSSLGLTYTDGVTANEVDEELIVTLTGTGYTGYVPIRLTGGLNQTIQLLNNKSTSVKYTGRSAGDVTITASCGDKTKSVVIEDLEMGYKPNNYKYNLNYSVSGSATCSETSDGLLFTVNGADANGNVIFNTDSSINSVEFTVVDASFDRFMFLMLGTGCSFNNLSNNDKIKLIKVDDTVLIYRNNQLEHQGTASSGLFVILGSNPFLEGSASTVANGISNYLKITDLKIK